MVNDLCILDILQIKYKLYLLGCSIVTIYELTEVEDQVQKIYHFMRQYEITDVFASFVLFVEQTNTDLYSFAIFCH